MAETITKKITKVNDNGFQVEGYENWFNLSNSYQGVPIPPVGTEIEFTYKPWQNKAGKTIYYVGEIIPVTQVAGPAMPTMAAGPTPPGTLTNLSPSEYEGMQAAAAPTPAPVAQAPRTEPEPLSADTGPVLGTHAYTSLSIERQVALKAAVETLNHCEGKYGTLAEAVDAVTYLAGEFNAFLNGSRELEPIAGVAMPDDTLVPTPSEMDGDPGPEEYRG